MSHMPLGAHGVAISTIFNMEIFKQIQQILEKFQYSDTDTSKLKSIQIQIQTDTDQSICIQIQILEKGLYLYLYPSEYLYLLNPISNASLGRVPSDMTDLSATTPASIRFL